MYTILTASGIPVRFSQNSMPMTNTFRHTLNSLAEKEIFPLSEDFNWHETLTPPPAKPTPRRLTVLTEPRARDEWTRQSSNVPDFAVQFRTDSDDKDHCRKYSWRGRNDKYKDRRYRENGSGMTRAVDAIF